MNSTQLDDTAIAQVEFNRYLEAQFLAIAPNIPSLVSTSIKVERIGFTRNASNTPYMVYINLANQRRCCTFIKRSLFLELVQALLRLKHGVEDCIQGMISSPDFGLSVKSNGCTTYIPRIYLNKFFERYNQVLLERTEPVEQCGCNDLYDMCLHAIAAVRSTMRSPLKDWEHYSGRIK